MEQTSIFQQEVCQPFFHQGSEDGILLMHGFTGSAAHMRKIADALAQKGYTVSTINLPGHATTEADMAKSTWQEWLQAAKQATLDLKAQCKQVTVCGLSMGGVLNVILDPILMFVVMPDGYEVVGAALATMLSNCAVMVYFILMYRKVRDDCILELPRRIERIERESLRSLFGVGVPAAMSVLLFDVTNMVINRLSSGYGDFQLAAMGIVLKVERLPLNIGIGICLGMVPLIAYNYASGDFARMRRFFSAARNAGLCVAVVSVVLYWFGAPWLIRAFIGNAETVAYGTQFLQARCFATPFMFLSFHMVHFMQAVDRGKTSFILAAIRQLALNIPILLVLNHFFGMTGIVWTQMTADILNVIVSYLVYAGVLRRMEGKQPQAA